MTIRSNQDLQETVTAARAGGGVLRVTVHEGEAGEHVQDDAWEMEDGDGKHMIMLTAYTIECCYYAVSLTCLTYCTPC